MKINDVTLQEGYMLRLERDKEILVLNITDTATGKRTEVRGKPGYETDGYDPTDKLHQLLDKVGRSASVSDMMNGTVVTINPKHPKGASAKTATDKAYHESLEEALGEISKNSEIYVDMDGVLADFFGEWSKSQGVDNWKDIKDPAKAIGDIKSIDDFWLNLPVLPKAKELLGLIKQVKGKYKIKSIQFDAHREGEARTSKDIKDSRIELYKKLVKKFATANNFEYADQAVARMHTIRSFIYHYTS